MNKMIANRCCDWRLRWSWRYKKLGTGGVREAVARAAGSSGKPLRDRSEYLCLRLAPGLRRRRAFLGIPARVHNKSTKEEKVVARWKIIRTAGLEIFLLKNPNCTFQYQIFRDSMCVCVSFLCECVFVCVRNTLAWKSSTGLLKNAYFKYTIIIINEVCAPFLRGVPRRRLHWH